MTNCISWSLEQDQSFHIAVLDTQAYNNLPRVVRVLWGLYSVEIYDNTRQWNEIFLEPVIALKATVTMRTSRAFFVSDV